MFPVDVWRWWLPAVLLLATPLGAAESRLVPRPGWSVELLMQAPELTHPTVVCTAPDGRIFVAEDPMDIRTARADVTEGRILCRHPDGRVTVYADQLYAVFGLQYLDGRLYVLHNPRFSVFADRGDRGEPEPDLIASTNPEPWAQEWNDHVPANFRLGMDGYFYGATGDKGLFKARGRDGREVSMRGGIFRIRPDGTGLESFSNGVRNILDVARTDEDEWFTYDNTDEHQWMSRLTHMVDGGFYGWPHHFIPRRDYTLWCLADYGGGAATGALYYDGGAWPTALEAQLYLSDFGKRQVTRVAVERDGATFRAVSREDLFPNPPADFRPVGICLTADGTGLLICDWQHRDTKGPEKVGRLWRLVPDGAKAPATPAWWVAAASGRPFTATDAELIAALGHTSRAVRDTAQRRLAERPSAKEALVALLRNGSAPSRPRIHALWALTAGGWIDAGWVSALAGSPDPAMARQALRWLGEFPGSGSGATLIALLDSPDPTRRFRAATALGRRHDTNALTALQNRLADGDAWVRFAAFTALNRIGRAHPTAWPAIASGLSFTNPAVRSGSRHAMRDTADAALVTALATRVPEGGPAAAESLAILGDLYLKRPEWRGEWWSYHPADSPAPAPTESWAGTPGVEAAVIGALGSTDPEVRRAAISAAASGRIPGTAAVLERIALQDSSREIRLAAYTARAGLAADATPFFAAELIRSPDPEVRTLALDVLSRDPGSVPGKAAVEQFWSLKPSDPRELASACATTAALKLNGLVPQLSAAASHTNAAVRAAAIAALGRMGDEASVAALQKVVQSGAPESARLALGALGGVSTPSARAILFQSASREPGRSEAIAALARHPGSDALTLYFAGLDLPDARVREQCRTALGQLKEPAWAAVVPVLERLSPSARAQLRLVFATYEPAKSSTLFQGTGAWTETDYLSAASQGGGNESRGRELFFSPKGPACSRCHRVGTEGGEIGPDLTHAGTQFDRVALAEAVLFPSQSVREGYQQTTLELKSGDSLNGLMRAEDAESLTLRDAEGRDHKVRKADIQERIGSTQSLMPEGLAAGLSPGDWSDLLAYLESLR
ncbi:MAG: HEAT repeat domain-containing protein [Verrucomicrobiota bacterium]